jgi:antitoxin component of MazEF toxin-antitoxin module
VLLLVKFYRKLFRTSQGYHGLAIPAEVAAHIGLSDGGYVALDVENGRIVITPVREGT